MGAALEAVVRFALFFAGLCAGTVWLSLQLGPTTLGGLAGFLTALGLVGPTLAYASGRPGLLGKSPAGSHPGWAQFLHGTYFGICRFTSTFARLRGDDTWNVVEPGVLLGARPQSGEVTALLDDACVGAVVDLTCELVDPARLRKRTQYLCLPVLDGTPPTSEQLTAGVDFIEQHRGDKAVYVHCAVGRGRSATLLVAWSLRVGLATTIDEAEKRLQQARPSVRLHPTQKAGLQRWWAEQSA